MERHNLAIDHCFIGRVRKSLHNGWITRVEVFVIARAEIYFAARFKRRWRGTRLASTHMASSLRPAAFSVRTNSVGEMNDTLVLSAIQKSMKHSCLNCCCRPAELTCLLIGLDSIFVRNERIGLFRPSARQIDSAGRFRHSMRRCELQFHLLRQIDSLPLKSRFPRLAQRFV
jgi:hypothetical protein